MSRTGKQHEQGGPDERVRDWSDNVRSKMRRRSLIGPAGLMQLLDRCSCSQAVAVFLRVTGAIGFAYAVTSALEFAAE